MPRYTTTLDLSIGGDTPTWEGEATVSYAVVWGRPETPPAFDHGGLPADPDEIDDVRVTHIDGTPVEQRHFGKHEAVTLETHIECDGRLVELLLERAAEQAGEDAAAAADAKAEARREAMV